MNSVTTKKVAFDNNPFEVKKPNLKQYIICNEP